MPGSCGMFFPLVAPSFSPYLSTFHSRRYITGTRGRDSIVNSCHGCCWTAAYEMLYMCREMSKAPRECHFIVHIQFLSFFADFFFHRVSFG